jgi:hypothetical protein
MINSRVVLRPQTKLIEYDYAEFNHPNLSSFTVLGRSQRFEVVMTLFNTLYFTKAISILLQ